MSRFIYAPAPASVIHGCFAAPFPKFTAACPANFPAVFTAAFPVVFPAAFPTAFPAAFPTAFLPAFPAARPATFPVVFPAALVVPFSAAPPILTAAPAFPTSSSLSGSLLLSASSDAFCLV